MRLLQLITTGRLIIFLILATTFCCVLGYPCHNGFLNCEAEAITAPLQVRNVTNLTNCYSYKCPTIHVNQGASFILTNMTFERCLWDQSHQGTCLWVDGGNIEATNVKVIRSTAFYSSAALYLDSSATATLTDVYMETCFRIKLEVS